MATQIHGAGPTGQRSPGLDLAIAAYLAENGGTGGGVELVSGTVTLDDTGQPVREFYCTGAATINGVAFDADTAVVFRRTSADVWGYIIVEPWTDLSATTTTTTTAATTTTTTTAAENLAPSMTLGAETIDGLDVSQPFTTSDPNADPVTVTADWDDGGSPEVVTSPATHTYAAAGTYDATFTPSDGTLTGAVRYATYTVTAGGLAPVGNPATLAEAVVLYGAAGYWKLDETTGTTATDSSGNGRDGSIVGAVGTDLVLGGEDGYLKWVSPGAGAAPSAWVDVPSSAAFSIPNPGAITVFACAKIVTANSNRMMVRKGVDLGLREWQFSAPAANTSGKVTATSGTFIAESSTGDNGNTAGTWRAHATVLPFPGGADVPIVYRDSGTPQTVTTNTQAGTYTASTDVLRIGAFWVGGLAHVAVFPHALTGAHVQKLVDLAQAEGVIP